MADIDITWDTKPDWRFFLNNGAFNNYPVDWWGIVDSNVIIGVLTKQFPDWTNFFVRYYGNIAYDAFSFHQYDNVLFMKQLTNKEADSIKLTFLHTMNSK